VRVSRKGMGEIGKVMADKLNLSRGPAAVAIPLQGFSDRNRAGDVFYDPEGDRAFISTLKKRLSPRIRVVEVDAHINDEGFASRACDLLTEMMAG
jgi:uncharacterized protein (UPF0261 family)